MIGPLLAICAAILVIAVCVRLVRIEGKERGDDDPWNWRGWRKPDDWPKLPPSPRGGGTPDYVPDAWVFEQFGPPRRLIPVKPSDPDSRQPPLR